MKNKSKVRGYLTPKETAEYLKVSTETVRQWAKTGLLNAETTLGGHRRFSRDEVLQKREQTKKDNLRILIVDDDQQYVRFVEELVTGFGDHISTDRAFDGFEAGHKIDIFKPDIVLLDLVMPSINGIEVCRYLKQNKHCLVWNEVAGVNNPMPITSDYLYVRLIGDRSIPDSEFGKVTKNKDALVASWAKKIQEIKDIPLAMVMTNNHFEGFGPATANSLRMHLGMRELIWEEKKQKTLGNF